MRRHCFLIFLLLAHGVFRGGVGAGLGLLKECNVQMPFFNTDKWYFVMPRELMFLWGEKRFDAEISSDFKSASLLREWAQGTIIQKYTEGISTRGAVEIQRCLDTSHQGGIRVL
jgi:hypothetical protein